MCNVSWIANDFFFPLPVSYTQIPCVQQNRTEHIDAKYCAVKPYSFKTYNKTAKFIFGISATSSVGCCSTWHSTICDSIKLLTLLVQLTDLKIRWNNKHKRKLDFSPRIFIRCWSFLRTFDFISRHSYSNAMRSILFVLVLWFGTLKNVLVCILRFLFLKYFFFAVQCLTHIVIKRLDRKISIILFRSLSVSEQTEWNLRHQQNMCDFRRYYTRLLRNVAIAIHSTEHLFHFATLWIFFVVT